jgi:hypothetical protein
MCEEREKVRCRRCELVQWSDRANCRRCGTALPEPVVVVVERVVEKVVIGLEAVAPVTLARAPGSEAFPTMAEVERAMILVAYQKSNRRPHEAARLLGIGKTTLYRKLREIGEAAASKSDRDCNPTSMSLSQPRLAGQRIDGR